MTLLNTTLSLGSEASKNKQEAINDFFRSIETHPYRYDFFQALRRLECLFNDKPRIGKALRPIDEAVRLAQEPSLAFAPSTIAAFRQQSDGKKPRMEVRFFGMLGVNGPLPIHLTEYARERLLHGGDKTFTYFLDIFNHRFLELFYRAWAQAQPTVNFDRPHEDKFGNYVGSLFGIGTPEFSQRDQVEDYAKLHFAGILSQQVRNPDGLAALLTGYFKVKVRIESFVGHWMKIADADRARLGADNDNVRLGAGVALGSRVWDRQHKFRVCMGPLTLSQYEDFLPSGKAIEKLRAWVRQYLCLELEWDLQLILAKAEVPKASLGKTQRLGWTTWLGKRVVNYDASDLKLDVEAIL